MTLLDLLAQYIYDADLYKMLDKPRDTIQAVVRASIFLWIVIMLAFRQIRGKNNFAVLMQRLLLLHVHNYMCTASQVSS